MAAAVVDAVDDFDEYAPGVEVGGEIGAVDQFEFEALEKSSVEASSAQLPQPLPALKPAPNPGSSTAPPVRRAQIIRQVRIGQTEPVITPSRDAVCRSSTPQGSYDTYTGCQTPPGPTRGRQGA